MVLIQTDLPSKYEARYESIGLFIAFVNPEALEGRYSLKLPHQLIIFNDLDDCCQDLATTPKLNSLGIMS